VRRDLSYRAVQIFGAMSVRRQVGIVSLPGRNYFTAGFRKVVASSNQLSAGAEH
jgi:hypothetical protein